MNRNQQIQQPQKSVSNQTDGIGPAQPPAGSPPPNLGHNGNGAKNSNGNYRGNKRNCINETN